MKQLQPLFALVVLFVAFLIPAFASVPDQAPVFSEARALAAEGSWALAAAKYEALLPKLTGEEARWGAFLLADARWQGEGKPNNWYAQQAWVKQHKAVYEGLLSAYTKRERPRDELWCRIKKSELALDSQGYPNGTETLRTELEILDYRSTEVRDQTSAQRYHAALIELSEALLANDNPNGATSFSMDDRKPVAARLFKHLKDSSASNFLTPDQRAWCRAALVAMQFHGRVPAKEQVLTTAEATRLNQGSSWEADARAYAFLDSVLRCPPELARARTLDLPAQLEQLALLAKALVPHAKRCTSSLALGELRALKRAWTNPVLTATVPEQIPSGEPLRFLASQTGFYSVRCEIYASTPEEWMVSMRTPIEGAEAVDGAMKGKKRIHSWLLKLPNPSTRVWTSRLETAPVSLKPGLYTLVLSGWHPQATHAQLFRFSVGTLSATALNSGPGDVTFFLHRSNTLAPLANARASILIFDQQGKREGSTELTTDANGQATLPAAALTDDNVRCLVGHEGHYANLSFIRYGNPKRELYADVFVERPLFKPGEKARWKLIARERREGRWGAPTQELSLELKRDEETLLSVSPLKLDSHGCAEGVLEIPPSTRPGYVFLHLFPTKHRAPISEVQTPLFAIDSFVTPPVLGRLTLGSAPDTLSPGRECIIRGKAEYFSGGPVPGAKASLKLLTLPLASWGQPADTDVEYRAWCTEISKQELQMETDAQGNADFRIAIPSFVKIGTTLYLRLTLAPAGSAPVSVERAIELSATGAFYRQPPLNDKTLVSPGATHRVEFDIWDALSRPVETELTLKLVELSWREEWRDPAGKRHGQRPAHLPPSLLPRLGDEGAQIQSYRGWKCLKAGYEGQIVAEQHAMSDRAGHVTADFDLPRAGLYEIQAWHKGVLLYSRGHEVSTRHRTPTLVAVDANTLTLPCAGYERFIAAPASPGKPGGQQEVLVVMPEGARLGILGVSSENTVAYQRFIIKDRIALLRVPVPADELGSFAVSLFDPAQKGAVWNSGYRRLPKLASERSPTLTVTPAVAQAKPGQRLRIEVASMELSGKVLPAQIALSVKDEAVTSLMGAREVLDQDFDTCIYPIMISSSSSGLASASSHEELLPDPRPGRGEQEDFVVLSPFEVSNIGTTRGYYAGSGDKAKALRMELADEGYAASAPSYMAASSVGQHSPVLRSHFSSSAFWAPSLQTDREGKTSVEFTLPDSLTTWRASAYAVADDLNRFATATTTFTASLDFQARLQTPRFLIEGDSIQLLGSFVNRTSAPQQASATLACLGDASLASAAEVTDIKLPPQGEARQVWLAKALHPGTSTFTLRASSGSEADAMELSVPVLEDGVSQPLAASALLQSKEEAKQFTLRLPDPLDPARTELKLQLSPSLAGAVVDALPYLIDYPYGCVEQTMNRFMPAVVVKKAFAEFGFDPARLEQLVLSRVADQRKQAAGVEKLDEVISKSLSRLEGAETPSHTFGWWPGAPATDRWMTAYVAWGLELARQAGANIDADFPSRVRKGLLEAMDRATDDTDAWCLASLSLGSDFSSGEKTRLKTLWNDLYAARQSLSPAGRACLVYAAATLAAKEQRAVLLRNMENAVVRSADAGLGELAQWGLGSGYWRAMDGAVEATSLSMLALLKLEPKHPLLPAAARWLVLNRRSANWSNTRDSAFAVLALTAYLRQSGEAKPGAEIEVLVNGASIGRTRFEADSLLKGNVSLRVTSDLLRPDENTFSLRRVSGDTPVYAIALSSAWARGDSVRAEGHLISVKRAYELERSKANGTQTPAIRRTELKKDDQARSGERLWSEITLSASQDFEYLMVEIPKPAGCEPLNPLSAWDAELIPEKKPGEISSIQSRVLFREEYDDRSVVFIDRLPAGTWTLRLGLQAVFAGDYRALPAKVQAMYVSEIRANTDARRILIESQ